MVGMCVPFGIQSMAEMKVVFSRMTRLMSMKDSGSSGVAYQMKKSHTESASQRRESAVRMGAGGEDVLFPPLPRARVMLKQILL